MEKGYRDYGHDLDNMDTLLEAGLGFTADFDKPGGFIGMEPTLEQKGKGPPTRRLVGWRRQGSRCRSTPRKGPRLPPPRAQSPSPRTRLTKKGSRGRWCGSESC